MLRSPSNAFVCGMGLSVVVCRCKLLCLPEAKKLLPRWYRSTLVAELYDTPELKTVYVLDVAGAPTQAMKLPLSGFLPQAPRVTPSPNPSPRDTRAGAAKADGVCPSARSTSFSEMACDTVYP